jgi:uncharacterized membrane protein YphA (DoxX/SURF4 family)
VTALDAIGVLAGVVVGAALMSAGFFKLRDGAAWPRQAAEMGVGRSLASVVPWVELILGAATAAQIFRPWPAVAAGLLLLVFTVLIVIRILDGSRPPCACFGSRSNQPLGASHLVRNFVLLALAAVAIWTA